MLYLGPEDWIILAVYRLHANSAAALLAVNAGMHRHNSHRNGFYAMQLRQDDSGFGMCNIVARHSSSACGDVMLCDARDAPILA